MAAVTPPVKRLYVGGLFPNVTEEALRERFAKFGVVCGVEIKQKKEDDGSVSNTFAYMNVKASEINLTKCFNVLSGTRWQGHEMRVHYAKENFLDRLKQEREADQSSPKASRTSANTVELGSPQSFAPRNQTEGSNQSYEPLALLQANLKSKPQKRKISSDSEEENDKKLPKFKGTAFLKDSSQSNQKSLLERLDKFSNVWTDSTEKRIPPPPQAVVDAEKKKVTPEAAAKAALPVEEEKKQENIEEKLAKRKEKLKSTPSKDEEQVNTVEKKVKTPKSPVKEVLPVKQTPKVEQEEKTLLEKAKLDNDKRVKSLVERRLATQSQHNLIRQALSSVDASKKKNIVRFDLDLDEEETVQQDSQTHQKPSKPKLFNEDEEHFEMETELRMKPQFGGEKGQKLLALQAKYGNDARFALSEKFAETVECKSQEAEPDETEENDEKKRQLAILESVVGKEVVKPTAPVKPVAVKNKTFLRYDPSEEGHKTLEKNTDSGVVDNDADLEGNEGESSGKPVVSQESYFTVNDNLTSLFKNPGAPSIGFSFRKAFGNEDQEEEERVKFTPRMLKKGLIDIEKDPEEPKGDKATSPTPPEVSGTYLKSTGMWKEPFFFTRNDSRFMDAVDFVSGVQDVSQAKEQWRRQREDLVHFYKNKVRRVNAQKSFQRGGGRGQHQSWNEPEIQGVASQQRQTGHRGGRGRGRGSGRGFGAQNRQRGKKRPMFG